ncbi:MAG: FlgB family protein [Rubellimicrobium sp.]|nr:FlgB family protein [Rubellimicrobium sp.]
MFDNLALFRLSAAQAAHAVQRLSVTAANVANADTPGFRAQTVDGFADMLDRGGTLALRVTRAGHMVPAGGTGPARIRDAGGQAAPNGNTVSLEREMIAGVEAGQEQARALAIYRHGLTVLRLSLGR